MWLPPVVTVQPASEPVTATEVKEHLRVDGTDEDTLINTFIVAARQLVEEYTGTRLISQTVVLRASDWSDLYDLPVAPIASVASVKYLDPDGVQQTLNTSIWESVLIGLEPLVRLKINQTWPSVRSAEDAIEVTASAGYATLPTALKAAIFLIIASWFDNRSVGPIPEGAVSLLENYRRF